MTTEAMAVNNSLTPKALSAYRSALLLAVAATAAVPLYVFLAVQANTWQVYLSLMGLGGFALIAWMSVRLCRRGETTKGMWALILANMAAALLVSAVIAEIGLPLGVVTFVAILQLSTQHLPGRVSPRAILFVTVAAITMAVLDYLSFDFQYVVPFLQTITFVIAGVVLVLYSGAVVRQFPTLPLRNKLLLSFLLVTFLAVSLVTFFTAQQARRVLLENANQSLLAAATQTANSLDTFIINNLDAIRIEAGFPDFVAFLEMPPEERSGSLQESRVRQFLLQLSRKNPTYILSYALVDTEGIHIADTFFPEQGLDASQLSYFQIPFQNGVPYVSPIEQSLTEGGLSLYFSAPVRNTGGTIVGVLRVSYNSGVIQQIINQHAGSLGEDSNATLLDEYGIRLADGDNPQLVMKSLTPLDSALIADLQAQRRLPDRPIELLTSNQLDFAAGLSQWETTPNFAAKTHGDDAAHVDNVAVVALETQPWRVAYSLAQSEFLLPIEAQTQTTTIVALIVALLVAMSAIGVAQVLTAPISRLTSVAEKVAAGDLSAKAVVESEDEIGTLATTFNNMTTQMGELIGTLEQRVEERTRALTVSTEVSRYISTILDPQQLVVEVVEQIRASFRYYHAHIYLIDEQQEYLVMMGGTGEVGRKLLAQGHKIRIGQGLVGRAAANDAVILVPDVTQEPGWLANPLLPDTKAEIAVPIGVGKQILGVLDVQNATVNSLTATDAALLQSIASQVAIAIQNARLYAQAQQQAERAALINEITQKIQSATTIERVLQVAAQELGQALKTQTTTVQISTHSESQNGYTA